MKVFFGIHLLVISLKLTKIILYWTNDFRENLISDNI